MTRSNSRMEETGMYLIKTEEEYESALVEFEELIDQDPAEGSENAKKLELIGLLISVYEEKHYPIDLPNPIEAIKFRMEQQGLRQRDLIPYIGSRSKVSEILNGKRPLTVKMIRSLHEELGIPSEILIQDLNADLSNSDSIDFDKVPFNEMYKRQWFEGFSGTLKQAKKVKDELLTKFFSEDRFLAQNALYRKSHFRGSETDHYALHCWKVRVKRLAEREPLKQVYKPNTVDLKFMQNLANLSPIRLGPQLVKEYLGNHGIYFIVEEHLPRTKLDGAALCLNNGSPIIAMTLRHNRIDNFWFCLFHELAHISKHLSIINEGGWFADDLDSKGNEIETEADNLAIEVLIPGKQWQASGFSHEHTQQKVEHFANSIKRHSAIIAGRIRKERNNYKILSKMVGQGEVKKLFDLN